MGYLAWLDCTISLIGGLLIKHRVYEVVNTGWWYDLVSMLPLSVDSGLSLSRKKNSKNKIGMH